MEIKVYLHRTKKKEFKIADCFSVFVDLDKLPEDKKHDINYINKGFQNDCQRLARTRDCIQKYGIGYISFMRPQYEGDEKDNGNNEIYFDNKEMLFMPKTKKKEEETNEKI